jgi:hypothetical protein
MQNLFQTFRCQCYGCSNKHDHGTPIKDFLLRIISAAPVLDRYSGCKGILFSFGAFNPRSPIFICNNLRDIFLVIRGSRDPGRIVFFFLAALALVLIPR